MTDASTVVHVVYLYSKIQSIMSGGIRPINADIARCIAELDSSCASSSSPSMASSSYSMSGGSSSGRYSAPKHSAHVQDSDGFEVQHRRKRRNDRPQQQQSASSTHRSRARCSSPVLVRQKKFVPTKFEKKSGMDARIDLLRTQLNKLTDKNYLDISRKIVAEINDIIDADSTTEETLASVGKIIFDIVSNNRFYSATYSDLYCELIGVNKVFGDILDETFATFSGMFDVIECADPNVDYDLFCQHNKLNETRKSLSSFFMNSMKNGVVEQSAMIRLLHTLLVSLSVFMTDALKKNEVGEIIENIGILYDKTWIASIAPETMAPFTIDGLLPGAFIKKITSLKARDYPGLSSKVIFKCMDILGV